MEKPRYPSDDMPQLRFRVNPTLFDEVHNIADNRGEPLSDFLRSKLIDIVQSYPEQMRKPKRKD